MQCGRFSTLSAVHTRLISFIKCYCTLLAVVTLSSYSWQFEKYSGGVGGAHYVCMYEKRCGFCYLFTVFLTWLRLFCPCTVCACVVSQEFNLSTSLFFLNLVASSMINRVNSSFFSALPWTFSRWLMITSASKFFRLNKSLQDINVLLVAFKHKHQKYCSNCFSYWHTCMVERLIEL